MRVIIYIINKIFSAPYFLAFFIIILSCTKSIGQCHLMERWKTVGYLDHETMLVMHLPMLFEFKTDTITVRNANPKMPHQKVDYFIDKGECEWDNQGLNGKAEFKIRIVSNNKKATLILTSNDGKGKIIIQMEDQGVYSPKFDVEKIQNK